jgi:hypothetical protein
MSAPQRPILALAIAAALTSCQTLECGENTIELDGKCVAMAGTPGAECGPGTTFDPTSGRCTSDLFSAGGGICGEGTTVVVNDQGVPQCVGTGVGGGCDTPLPCPPPTDGNAVSMCGRIYDLQDSRPLDDGNPDNGEPHRTVELRVLNPFEFIQSPTPTILARAVPDSCGRYAIVNAPRPAVGFIALAVDDLTDEAGQPVFGDNIVITGIADAVAAGDVLPAQRAWILRRETDALWSTSAGLPEGQTFGQLGVYVPIFLTTGVPPVAPFPGAPTPDVMVAVVEGANRVVKPEQDFYFDDSDPLARTIVGPGRTATGPNGTGLFIMQAGIPNFSGVGNTPPDACWAVNPAATPPGAVFVQERTAEVRFCQQ